MTTDNYGFETGITSLTDDDGRRFVTDFPMAVDRLIHSLFRHHHIGGAATDNAPDTELDLDLAETGGTLPAGKTINYVYTWVDPDTGETTASPVASVVTPDALASPDAPGYAVQTIGGSLLAGQYMYAVSEYKGPNTVETMANNRASVLIPGGSTNAVELTLPALTDGDGFNIYRLVPNGGRYLYLDSVAAVDVGDPYVDDGSITPGSRGLPSANTTNATNAVTATLPEAPPAGNGWKLYRTFGDAGADTSYLANLDEATTDFVDTGLGTTLGAPPTVGDVDGNPDPIDLEPETQGHLPVGRVDAFPTTVQLELDDDGDTSQWVCEFPAFEILGCRLAAKQHGDYPTTTTIIADVNLRTAAGSETGTIYTTGAGTNRPRLVQLDSAGDRTVPDVTDLVEGDTLWVEIDQTDTSGTPFVGPLLLIVYGVARYTSEVVGTIT